MVSVIIFVFINVNFVIIQIDIVISLSIEAASRKTVDGVAQWPTRQDKDDTALTLV